MAQAAMLTWNLHGRPSDTSAAGVAQAMARVTSCMERLSRHVSAKGVDRAVAVFQEVPDNFDAIIASATGAKWSVVASASYHAVVAVMGEVTASSAEAIDGQAHGTGNRAVRVDITGLLPRPLRVVGVHWLDRISEPPGPTRQTKAGKFWSIVRQQWEFPQSPDFVVLGDLNENPYDHAVVSRECLWAIRDRNDLKSRAKHFDGRPPLFNPMWRFLPESLSPPHGTHHYFDPDDSGIRWCHLDQILISPSLLDHLKDLNILVSLDGVAIVSARGVPDEVNASDHLPVMAILGAQDA